MVMVTPTLIWPLPAQQITQVMSTWGMWQLPSPHSNFACVPYVDSILTVVRFQVMHRDNAASAYLGVALV